MRCLDDSVMKKLLALLVAATIFAGGRAPANTAPAPQRPMSWPRQHATVRVWRAKNGDVQKFAAGTVREWLKNIEKPDPGPLQLLLLLGRSPEGIWTLEGRGDDGGYRIQLVRTDLQTHRQAHRIVEFQDRPPRSIARIVHSRLIRFAKQEKWAPDRLVELQLLPKPPVLFDRQRAIIEKPGYSWDIYATRKGCPIVRVTGARPSVIGPFIDHYSFAAGVAGAENTGLWWILVLTRTGEYYEAQWHVIQVVNR